MQRNCIYPNCTKVKIVIIIAIIICLHSIRITWYIQSHPILLWDLFYTFEGHTKSLSMPHLSPQDILRESTRSSTNISKVEYIKWSKQACLQIRWSANLTRVCMACLLHWTSLDLWTCTQIQHQYLPSSLQLWVRYKRGIFSLSHSPSLSLPPPPSPPNPLSLSFLSTRRTS